MSKKSATRTSRPVSPHATEASAPGADADQPLSHEERAALTNEILLGLEERGVPAGAWLVDIGRVRHALREADALLRRLEEAIIRAASSSPLDAR
jgi:hypothetical protein